MESDADLPVRNHPQRHNRSFDIIASSRDHQNFIDKRKHNASFDDVFLTSSLNQRHYSTDSNLGDKRNKGNATKPPEMLTGSDNADNHPAPNTDVTEYPNLKSSRDDLERGHLESGAVEVGSDLDDSLDSVIVEGSGGDGDFYDGDDDDGGGLKGVENEAYDGDAETDLSYSYPPSSPAADHAPVIREPNPFPVLERPVSGRYQKNPHVEKAAAKASAAPGPYDPNIGVFLAPPLATTTIETKHLPSSSSPSSGVRKRLPRPPSRLRMRCALGWSCFACWIGSFLCAIPALRCYVTANESRRIGDYSSAHSALRKSALLAAVAVALGLAGWTLLILYLSDSF